MCGQLLCMLCKCCVEKVYSLLWGYKVQYMCNCEYVYTLFSVGYIWIYMFMNKISVSQDKHIFRFSGYQLTVFHWGNKCFHFTNGSLLYTLDNI